MRRARRPRARSLRTTSPRREASRSGPLIYVRINALDTNLWEDDVAGIAARCPTASCCPRRARGRTCTRSRSRSTTRKKKRARQAGSTRIIALVTETPISLLQLHTYVGSSTRLDGVTWGAEDLSAVLGARTNREDDGRTWTSPYMLARNLCLFTAAAAEAQPIDTVFVNFRDEEGLRQECRTRRATASRARWRSTPTRWRS